MTDADLTPLPELINLMPGIDEVTCFSTTRGCSNPADPYDGFNICHYTGSSDESVNRCREILCHHLGIDSDRLIVPRQTHSCRVVDITAIPVKPKLLNGADAMITALRGVALAINTADCTPVALYAPAAGIIGIAHAGWRGAAGGIVTATVEAMIRKGANPADITAALGPHICRDCFEVGPEVASQFPAECVSVHVGSGKPHVDLAKAIASELKGLGVTRLTDTSRQSELMCSRCHPDQLFSARRLGVASGRTATVIMMAAPHAQKHL